MFYQYECPACGATKVEQRSVADRDVVPLCWHTQMDMQPYEGDAYPMDRVIMAQTLVINAHMCKDHPENKYALGFSEKDRLETLNAHSREYEKTHRNWNEPAPETEEPLAKVFHEVSREVGVHAT